MLFLPVSKFRRNLRLMNMRGRTLFFVFAVLVSWFFSNAASAQTELFFSEYIEGSSNNKALEIYNGTGAAINLATGSYDIQMFFNGSATAGLTIALTGTVANGDVYVLAQASSVAAILAQADQTSTASFYNGDDAVVLRKGGVIIDVIGQIGFDPGTEWGTGLTSTADNTIRRKASILAGDANGADVFDPSIEWDGFANDTFTGLGAHATSDAAPGVITTTPTNGATNIAVSSNITITFSEAVNVTASWFTIAGGSSGSHTATVSGGPTTFTLDPDIDFANNETVTVTVVASNVTDQDTNDPPDNMTTNFIFSFSTPAADVAPSVAATTPTNGATNVAINSDVTITFSEPVNVTGSWFSLSGATSGSHTATVSGGPTTFTLNPDVDFANNETVTVTAFAANVTDQDASDPPDNMTADFNASFTTIASDIAPTVASTTPNNNDAGVDVATNITVNFSEPVNVAGSWFSLSGSVSGAHTAAVSGGPTSFTLNPDINFNNGETVTVTIFAANVTDQDATDPPDNMTSDHVFSFMTPSLIINEILADPSSTAGDANGDGTINTTQDEFIEFINVTGAPLNISGWTISDAVQVRHTFPANTIVTSQCGIVIFGGGTPTGAFGNTVVQVANASGNSLGLNNTGDTITLRNGTIVIATYTYGSEGGADESLTRNPDVTGPTPLVKHTTATGAGGRLFSAGLKVDATQFSGCDPIIIVTKEIFEIQGNGTASPFVNQTVTTENNVVTAVASNGFAMQTPTARSDNDAQTSDGIFVFTSSAPTVSVGDFVNVTGQVIEFFNFTEFSNGPTVTFVSSGNPLPAPVQLDGVTPSPNQPQSATEFERFEGMRVEIASGVVTSGNQTFGTDPTAEVLITSGSSRPFREPGIEFPGLAGLPVWDGNPEIFELDPDRLGQSNATIPGGSTFSATGVLGYEFNDYEFWPTSYSVNAATFPRAVRARNSGEITIATLNALQYFDDVDDPGIGETVKTTQQYLDKQNKLSMYIRTLLGAPDILAMQEVEKLGVLQALVNKIHNDDASLTYTPYLVEGNDVGGIDVGFLVRGGVTVNSVTQLGATETLSVDGSLLHDRPPLLLDATLANGCAISVLVVHQRSLNDIDSPSSGARVRQKRHEQAVSVANMVQGFQTANPNINLVVTGDFNAFQFSDGYVHVLGQIMGTPASASEALIPGTDVVNPDLTNAVLALPANEQYSYVFEGSAQILDHMLVSQTLHASVTGIEYARANSDAANIFENDGSTVLRTSDHDGLVLFVTPNLPVANAGADQAICVGQSIAIGGNPTASSGTAPYTFSWTPATGLNDATLANPTASPAVTTTYTVEVTDATGCKSMDEVTVTVNPLPTASISGNDPVNAGSTNTYTATTNASSPTYSWSVTNGTINGSNTGNSVSVTAGSAGTMVVSVTVSDGVTSCSNSATKNVTVNACTLAANAGADRAVCIGQSTSLGGSPTASGGTPPYTFSWAPATGLNDATIANPTATPAATTTYTVTVNDAGGCSTTDQVIVTVNALPTVSISGNDPVNVGSTQTYSVTTNASSPAYSWSVTNGTINGGNTSNSVSVTAGAVGTMVVNVTVTDGVTTCSNSATKNVTVTAGCALTVDAGSDRKVLYALTTTLGGTPTVTGGTPPYTYSWTPATGLDNPAAANPKARITNTTTFTVIVTDANSCSGTDQVTITVENYVLLSNSDVKITQNKTSKGDIHANNDIEFQTGAPGTHVGNLTAMDDITIQTKNTIQGNATAGDNIVLSGTATITGTKQDHAVVAQVALPGFIYTAGGQNVNVPANGTRTLTPGSYGTVRVNSKATLLLSAGDYFFNTLDAGASSTILSINAAAGVVNIFVVNDLRFGSSMQVKLTGGTSDKVLLVTLQTSKLVVGSKAILYGTLVLPNAPVQFSSNGALKGAVFATSITLDSQVKFLHHTSPGTFPKASDESGGEDTGIAQTEAVTDYALEQNYPNPFNPSTMISFRLPEASRVTVTVYSVTGQRVRELVNGEMAAGVQTVFWDSRDQAGEVVAAGIYLYRLVVTGANGQAVFMQTRRMAFVK